MQQDYEFLIIGAGFGGIGSAIRLLQSGVDNILILEKSDEIGGTWYYNCYPGAACDVQSHMYSLSYVPNADWSYHYAGQQEIQEYMQRTFAQFGLDKYTRRNCCVAESRFDEQDNMWVVKTVNGDVFRSRYLVSSTGPLHIPSMPNIPGLESFTGKQMHTSSWDNTYDLKGKRVAIIGTGASAVQVVPAIAAEVGELLVFQRTAAWVMPRDERAYSNTSKWLFRNIPGARKIHRWSYYWFNELRGLLFYNPAISRITSKAITHYIKRTIKNPETVKKLIPNYMLGCKRVLLNNGYYKTFNRENVQLLTDGIARIDATGIVDTTGKHHAVDLIVLATGFIVEPRKLAERLPAYGLGGRSLAEAWSSSAKSYYGVLINGFPNFFQLLGPNSGLGHNSVVFMIECQIEAMVRLVKAAKANGIKRLQVREEVQNDQFAEVQENFAGTVWVSGCSSWYQSNGKGENVALWPHSTWRYWMQMRRVSLKQFEQ